MEDQGSRPIVGSTTDPAFEPPTPSSPWQLAQYVRKTVAPAFASPRTPSGATASIDHVRIGDTPLEGPTCLSQCAHLLFVRCING